MHYLILFFIILFGYFISRQYPKSQIEDISYWLLYVVIALTAGFRYETGTDYFAYTNIYNGTNTLIDALRDGGIRSTYGNAEIGYMFMNSLFRTMGLDVNWMFFCISSISLYLIFKSVSQYCFRYRFLIILTYFCFCFFILDMSAARQVVAVSIFIYSLRYLLERKLWKYLLCSLIAISFHNSAVILIPIYWIINRKIPNLFIYASTFVAFVVIILKIPLLEIIVQKIFEPIMPGSAILYKLALYSSNDGMTWGFNLKVVIYIGLLLYVAFNRKKLESQTPYFNILLNLLFYYVLLRQLLWESADINSRLNYYFITGLIFCLPLVLSLYYTVKNKLIVLTVVLGLNFYQGQTWFLESPLTQAYNPYQNYLIHKTFNLQSDGYERNQKQKEIEVTH